MFHLIVLAGCFPNCVAPGHTNAVQNSGSAALGFAFIGVILLLFLSRKGKGSGSK